MNVLIVDDQLSVVEGLKNHIDWASLGVEGVFVAVSAHEAKEIIEANSIDLLLTDIEMPEENGLELVSWVRKQNVDCLVIILSSHEVFTYAKESIKLGVFDYIVQPSPYSEIYLVVKKAIQEIYHRKETQIDEKKKAKDGITSYALWELLNGTMKEEVYLQYIKENKLPSSKAYLCGIEIVHGGRFKDMTLDLRLFAFQNVCNEVFYSLGERFAICSIEENFLVLLLWGKLERDEEVLSRVQFLTRLIFSLNDASLSIYLSTSFNISKLREVYNLVYSRYDRDISSSPKTEIVDVNEKKDQFHFVLDQINEWTDLFKNGCDDLVEKKANQVLDTLIIENKLNKEVLFEFRQDFLQSAYNSQVNKREFRESLLAKGDNNDIYRLSKEDVFSMRKLIHLVCVKVRENSEDKDVSLITKIDGYILDHMEEDISRQDIADYVFLNPDYLNRVFKKSTGESINQYIINKKLERARNLIRTSRMPIQEVAKHVGYQVSYLSSSYKKRYGISPLQERKED